MTAVSEKHITDALAASFLRRRQFILSLSVGKIFIIDTSIFLRLMGASALDDRHGNTIVIPCFQCQYFSAAIVYYFRYSLIDFDRARR